ncbi:E-selectin-like [Dysidea avara]|uniref:E-selectin-like n=1 Tax=Dysidea avara TaxID=196820 RepID=UPI003333C7F4
MDATITTTFWYDHPNVTFDCRIHKKNFKDCTSPHTYFEDVVRFGNNVVRVRTQCIGQVNDRPTRDFTIVICEPLSLDHGIVDCQYGDNGGPNAGDICTLTCDDGYLINGSDIRECRNDATWSYFDAECYESGCTVTTINGEITSGDLSITVNFTSDVPNALFECKLNDREFVSCTSPHTYGSEEVSLGDNQVQVRAKCLDQMGDTAVEVFYINICEPLILNNGTVDCEFGDNGGPNAGDTCNLACSDNFVLNGSDVRTCMEDGTWSGDDGVCTFSDCEVTTVTGEISSQDLTITVNFTSDDPQASFECKLNNKNFVSCTSPHTYGQQQVRVGDNQVRVRARCP